MPPGPGPAPDRARRVQGSPFVTTPSGMNARLQLCPDGHVEGSVTLSRRHEGPPRTAHGGALAALLDEVMGAAAWAGGHRVVAVNLNVSYRFPVPLGVPARLSGRVDRVEGRKIFTTGSVVLADGRVATEATGIYVEAPQFFDDDDGFAFGEFGPAGAT